MQLITFLSAAAVAVATASADASVASVRNAVTLNKNCDKSKPFARVINRCDYPVNLWSVWKGQGCPDTEMVTLKKGETYTENYANTTGGVGISIKISKTQQCKGNDITQLEYYLETEKGAAFNYNYLDVSYVDCTDDCPTKKEGYYLQAGSSTARAAKASADNSWCPILSCSDPVSCAKMSYINPDDVQTKTCDLQSSMDFYMCGSHGPDGDDETPASSAPAYSAPAASSSKKVVSSAPASSAPKPSTTLKAVVSSAANYKANVAAVTNAPDAKKVKTQVVYVTAYEYINAKRHEHAHAHARRHQPFNA